MSNVAFAWHPDLADTATIATGITRSGLSQLRRSWLVPEPRAAVLIVHGIAEHSGRYEHVARQFNAAGFAVVSYDQRGHGRSGGPRGHVRSFTEFHDDVEDHLGELAALGVPRILLGHSMGGLVSAGYGLQERRPQPDLVVLSAPALDLPVPRAARTVAAAAGRLLGRTSMQLRIDATELATDPRVGDHYLADPNVELDQSLGLLGAMVDSARVVESKLPRWQHRSLVIHGLDDKIVLPRASEPLADFDHVTRRTYPGLRHELFNEPQGPEVVGDVVDWLDANL